jgi:acetolactate synthase regulatory subunit
VSLVSAATQDGARGLREGMERREAVVVVKVVSGDQNSLRGQIGLERVLRWSQARTGAVCRMQHKYRPGETTPGELGIIMFLAARCKIAAAAATAEELVAVAVVVAGQRHTGRRGSQCCCRHGAG